MYTNYDEKNGFLIAEDTLIMYSGQSESVTIPAEPERGHFIRLIGNSAFQRNSKLRKVVIPEGVQEIGSNAFGECASLKSVVLPHTLRKICDCTFSKCSELEEIVIPEGVQEIGHSAFRECTSLKRIVLPKALQTIGRAAFYGCSALEEIVIPDGVQEIGSNAFDSCSALRRVVLPQTRFTIQKDAFAHCNALKQANIEIQFSNTQIDMLRNNSRESADGQLFVMDSEQYPQLHTIACAISGHKTATPPENIPILFQDLLDPAKRQTRSVFTPMDCIRFDGQRGKISEDEAFRQLLESGKFGPEIAEDERQSDLYHRTEKAQPFSRVVIPSFNRNHIKQKGGYASLHFTLNTGWYFWQSVQKVVWKGKRYFIYRRHYLSGDSTRPFDRLDMAVYDKDGLVTDRKISEEVYAKYRLLSLL